MNYKEKCNLALIKASKLRVRERETMPQLDKSKVQDFILWLSDKGKFKKYTTLARLPDNLKQSQKEINMEIVKKIMQNWKGKDGKPIVVSKDGYIIDGHHRWQASEKLNAQKDTMAIVVDSKAPEAIKLLRDFADGA